MATFQVIKSLCIRQQNFRIPDNGIRFADMSRTRTQPGIHGMIEFFYNIPGNRILGRGGAYPTTPIGVLVIVFSGVVVRLCAGQSLPNCLLEPNGCIKSHFPVSIHVIYPWNKRSEEPTYEIQSLMR